MYHGRKIIYTDLKEVTAENVIAEVNRAMLTHTRNRNDLQYLWNYWRGITPIDSKEKEVRPEINHKINENRAYEVVGFFLGYTFGEAIQYVRREMTDNTLPDDSIAGDINMLNGYMIDASKASVDTEMAEWLYVGGTSYRMVEPVKQWVVDNPPFNVFSLDPRNTFVAYYSGYDHRPVYACTYVELESGGTIYDVYTKDRFYEFSVGVVPHPLNPGQEPDYVAPDGVVSMPNTLGYIPIIEYPANTPRLGVFEPVLPLLDALNELQSNRMDDIVQYVNSFLAIIGGDVDEETYNKILQYKMLCVPDGVDAKYIGKQMNETDVQTLKNDLYSAIIEITGMPNRNGGASTSDTGTAVQLRDGWQSAESRAKATELSWKKSERKFLEIVLSILRDTVGTSLKVQDIEAHFTRRNYENIVSKAQVLTTMLENGKIHPELAFKACGLFTDPESAYLQSEEFIKEKEENELKRLEAEKEIESRGETDDDSTGENQMPSLQEKVTGLIGHVPDTMSTMQIDY